MIVKNCDDIFNEIGNSAFLRFLNLAHKYNKAVPIQEIYDDWINGNKKMSELYNRWEKSVQDGNPDYSVYNDLFYLEDAFGSWKGFSRRYMMMLRKYINGNNSEIDKSVVKSVIDLGCGCGYSTIGLKSLFPDATIYGTNLVNTLQWYIDVDVFKPFKDIFPVAEQDTLSLDSVDLVFASEFFEHLDKPIDLLLGLIQKYKPKYFVFANTFTKMSLGHFYMYSYNGSEYDGKAISRLFNKCLRDNGYVKVNTGFFNNRPQLYRLADKTSKGLF